MELNPWHSYGVSLAIWDHTVLPATRHKWTHSAFTPARQAGTRFTDHLRVQGSVSPGPGCKEQLAHCCQIVRRIVKCNRHWSKEGLTDMFFSGDRMPGLPPNHSVNALKAIIDHRVVQNTDDNTADPRTLWTHRGTAADDRTCRQSARRGSGVTLLIHTGRGLDHRTRHTVVTFPRT